MINKFISTVKMTPVVMSEIAKGRLVLQTGQWIESEDGSMKGQYIGWEGDEILCSPCHVGDGFYGRTQRFVRSVRHVKKREPDTIDML